jgi:hypothetical protein
VILAARRVVKAFSTQSNLKAMQTVEALGDVLNRWETHSSQDESLTKTIINVEAKKVGISMGRKACLDEVRRWELSGQSISELIFKLGTMKIDLE